MARDDTYSPGATSRTRSLGFLSRRLEACCRWPDQREPDLCVDACPCGPGPGGEIRLRHERLSERRQWGSIPAGAGRINTPAGIQL